ncbi:Cuticular protein [Nesidiocoris tenuis]|uniref:Cuticular protein n=1 Tax=Nesidiocoris tenuis TaxID=355587 RepID=A0ABN7AC09_9HEMI|nr:Cuticular protein [Nesidiocoris tenuis]
MVQAIALVTLALVGSALCQFVHQAAPIPILSRTEVRDDHGQFALSYTTGDGQARSEHGALKQTPEGDYVLVQQGTVAYTSPEGIPVSLSYVADENGYRPEGTHIPQPPVPIH